MGCGNQDRDHAIGSAGANLEVVPMCDYSLESVATRPAQVGDKVVTGRIAGSFTSGFSPVGVPNVAVCLRSGTELAFDDDIAFEVGSRLGAWVVETKRGVRVARFRQIDMDKRYVHHDALELPDGEVVLLTRLAQGQQATVLQLPADGLAVSERIRDSLPA
jgi:hypothetical protein